MQAQFEQLGKPSREPADREPLPPLPPTPQPARPTGGGVRVLGLALVALGGLFLGANLIGISTGALIAPFILAGIGLPFYAVYRHDSRHWWALIPAFIMWMLGGLVLLLTLHVRAEPVVAAMLAGMGVPFLTIYFMDRKHWWALIPAYALAYFAGLPLLIWTNLPAGFIVAAMLGLIAPPFVYVYLRDQRQWWALIPAYTFAVLAGLPLGIELNLRPEFVIGYLMFGCAAPFVVVYARDHKHWWALIPAGVLGSAGLILVAVGAIQYVPVIMILLGIYLLVRQAAHRKVEERPPAE